METTRQQKYARLLQKELGDIFQADIKGLFQGAFITVTQVRITPDLAIARVYLSFLAAKDPKGLLDEIEDQKKAVRNELGKRIGKQVRIIPTLSFYLDDSAEYAAHIDKLMAGIEIPPADKDYNIPDDQDED